MRGASWLEAGHGADPVDAPIERCHDADAAALGTGNEVGLGEVETVELLNLHGSQEEPDVENLHGIERQDGPGQLGDPGSTQG
ncbi:MAG: hypothetical protein ACYC1D_16815 [Acidimicrobiales bacterium]